MRPNSGESRARARSTRVGRANCILISAATHSTLARCCASPCSKRFSTVSPITANYALTFQHMLVFVLKYRIRCGMHRLKQEPAKTGSSITICTSYSFFADEQHCLKGHTPFSISDFPRTQSISPPEYALKSANASDSPATLFSNPYKI